MLVLTDHLRHTFWQPILIELLRFYCLLLPSDSVSLLYLHCQTLRTRYTLVCVTHVISEHGLCTIWQEVGEYLALTCFCEYLV